MIEGLPSLPTMDIEALNWTIPIAVGFYDGIKYHEFIKEKESQDVVWDFLTFLRENYYGYKIYAHCASRFDNKFIMASLVQHGEKINLDMGLVSLKWEGPNICFEDSYLLVPMSLERAAHLFGAEEKKEWDFSLQLNPWEMGEKLGIFRNYLKTDCMSLSQIMFKVCELMGTTFGVMPSISLSTTAVKVFDKCFYDIDKISPNEEFEDFIRDAIYGGRNEVYCKYGEKINIYDIKSMYVSCYNEPVPIGQMRWIKPDIEKGTLCEATVKVPKDLYIGPLPLRRHGKLIFPTGEFTSWWDTCELRNSLKFRVDVKIRRQLCAEEEPVMDSFGKFIGYIRGNKNDEFWKMFGLSVTGKLGQSRWRDDIKHISDIKDLQGWTPLDGDEKYFSTKRYVNGHMPYVKPAIDMRIRAKARIKHLDFILGAMKKGKVFYGDTDSLYTTAKLPIGKQVGELVSLGKAERGYFIRQKLYGYVQRGKLVQKSSGYSDLKLSEEDFKDLLNGKTLDTDTISLPSVRSVLREEEVKLLSKGRKIRVDNNKENRVTVGEDTEPVHLVPK